MELAPLTEQDTTVTIGIFPLTCQKPTNPSKSNSLGDSDYLGRSAQTSGENTLFVVLEFQFGTLAAVLATLGAFVVYKKHKSTKQ